MKLKRLALAAALASSTLVSSSMNGSALADPGDNATNGRGLANPTVQPVGFLGTAGPTQYVTACDTGGCDTGDCHSGILGDGGDCGDGGHCDLSRHGTGIFNGQFLNADAGDEPFSLLPEVMGYQLGGWVQLGYHSQNLPLFNSRKHDFQLHQAWLYAEKAVDGSCGLDIGGRIDYVYGTDGPDTQAFGIDNTHWDNQWDNGGDYGHALPQVYGEVAYGDWTAKVGHSFTIIGYEVVAAPENFFYSHAYTMYNSEPFTHTGALLSYRQSKFVEFYGGYVMGWDSGFEDNGDAILGGSSVDWTDDINVTSTFVAGRFADNSSGDERGIMSSTVAQVQLTDVLSYVFQTDYLDTEDNAGNTVRETFGINQYLFRDIGDSMSLGLRAEWWNVQADSTGFYGENAMVTGIPAEDDFDIYAITLGLNFRPHSNLVVRPEIRWDYLYGASDDFDAADIQFLDDEMDDQQTTFGIDTILLF